jgi:arginase
MASGSTETISRYGYFANMVHSFRHAKRLFSQPIGGTRRRMTRPNTCILVPAPVEAGAGRRGADMGARAFRAAGLAETLRDLGYAVIERPPVAISAVEPKRHPNAAIGDLGEIAAWTAAIEQTAYEATAEGFPIFLGGDHSLSAGSIAGISRRRREQSEELFVLWLDAHPDFHTLDSSTSGNLHGVPMAYVTGRESFAGWYPPLIAPVKPENVCMVGLRSVDPAEREALALSAITVHDMRAIDENGVGALVGAFLDKVAARGGILHVSFDVDFLDPDIAPGVGTTVPGGASFREAHLVMEMLHDAGLVRSLDLVELNPFLDDRGRTAVLLVDLVASLMGRRILDRPTRRWS